MVERVLSCGMPCVFVFIVHVDCACCVCVDCCLFLKYDLKKLVVSGMKLKSCSSFRRSFSWEMVS